MSDKELQQMRIQQAIDEFGGTAEDWHIHPNGGAAVHRDADVHRNVIADKKATIRGGVIRGGVIWGGEIRGGVIRGGVIWGGVIWGGVIWGGEIRGGDWNVSPLFIQGSRDSLITCSHDEIGIGCLHMTPKRWLSDLEKIGRENRYGSEEIEEYRSHIEHMASMIPALLERNAASALSPSTRAHGSAGNGALLSLAEGGEVMSEDTFYKCALFFLAILLAVLAGGWLGQWRWKNIYWPEAIQFHREAAVQHGVAEYVIIDDAGHSEFRWITASGEAD